MKPTPEALLQRLKQHFPDAHITVQDDSHHHRGHAGAAGGGGGGGARAGLAGRGAAGAAARPHLVYDAVADWMPHRIHALSIRAEVPGN